MTTSPEIVVFPNAVPVVISYLAQHLGNTATVSASIPPNTNFRATLPRVLVVPQGGGYLVRKQLDEVLLSINVFHNVEKLSALDDLGRRVRAIIESMQGQRFGNCAVTRTREISGLARLPDSDPLIVRAGFTVSLLVRPL